MSNCTELVKALRANIADPTNVTWRRVLAALAAVEAKSSLEVNSVPARAAVDAGEDSR